MLKEKDCPKCGQKGITVKVVTVKSLVSETFAESVAEQIYFACLNSDCDVAYFTESGDFFTKDQVRVPIWYKKGAQPKYICYCSRVTEEEIIKAIIERGAKTVDEICEITGAMENSNCRVNNPLGKCCARAIQEIIERF